MAERDVNVARARVKITEILMSEDLTSAEVVMLLAEMAASMASRGVHKERHPLIRPIEDLNPAELGEVLADMVRPVRGRPIRDRPQA
jgi:hypothetical protein